MPPFGPTAVRVDTAHIHLIRVLMRYHDDQDYVHDIAAICEQALDCLERAQVHYASPAIVLDIDETSLANEWSKLLRREAHGVAGERYSYYDQDEWNRSVEGACSPAIAPTLAIYRVARARGWDVIFITGRPHTQRAATESNLRNVGFEQWTEVVMRGEAELNIDASVYKSAARRRITEDGHTIVVNVGDQASDLSGGYADHTFKLPNPFYFVA